MPERLPEALSIRRLFVGALLVLAAALSAAPLPAGDWPQILGPDRNGIAADEQIADSIAGKGPAALWQYSVGEGFAGVAVSQGKVAFFHRKDDREVFEVLDARTGKRLAEAGFPATYPGGISADRGPRCVPLIHEEKAYLLGAAGDLHCVSLAEGKVVWSRAAYEEYGAPEGFFGAGSTPIVEGDRLLVNVGGRKGAGIVAFSLADGKTLWKSTDEQASYSSPVATTLDGTRHVIFVTRLSALSIDPASGKVRWKFPFGARGPTVNAASPLVLGDHLFLSASYGVGAVYAEFDKTSARTVWASDETMSSQYSTSVYHDGYLYGVDGRSDVPPATLRCFEAATGKIRWSQEDFGIASLIAAGGKLILLKEDGTLVLARPSPRRYEELGRARVLETTTRALPALAGGLLYARDTRTLKCLDLRP